MLKHVKTGFSKPVNGQWMQVVGISVSSAQHFSTSPGIAHKTKPWRDGRRLDAPEDGLRSLI